MPPTHASRSSTASHPVTPRPSLFAPAPVPAGQPPEGATLAAAHCTDAITSDPLPQKSEVCGVGSLSVPKSDASHTDPATRIHPKTGYPLPSHLLTRAASGSPRAGNGFSTHAFGLIARPRRMLSRRASLALDSDETIGGRLVIVVLFITATCALPGRLQPGRGRMYARSLSPRSADPPR
jgi:hypothetical protein